MYEEATIAEIHAGFAAGTLSCRGVVEAYLARIDAYEHGGPRLHSLITVSDTAVATAVSLDERYANDPDGIGPLHGIPVLLKDNYNTTSMPTSSGSVVLKDMVPPADAFVVARLREAGAIVLAKTNLQEFARGGESLSSLGGQVLNPYDLTRTPGGSSGGTGAAIAANLGMVGAGSDTGQSIRSPASANCLVGVRPTRGLISRAGIAPNSATQDEVGPITRTVEDAARMLDVMVGYDPDDPVTALGVGRVPKSYLDRLEANALSGVSIGLLTDLLGDDAELHGETNAAVEAAIGVLRQQGARVVTFTIPDFAALCGDVSTDRHEAVSVLESYLQKLGPAAPVRTMADIIATNSAVPAVQACLVGEAAVPGGMASAEYLERVANRERLKIAVLAAMADLGLDAVLYPHQKRLVVPIGESQLERNGALSHGTGLPAVTFPAGFSLPTATAPLGVPIGIELLGREFSEPALLAYAYAFEQATGVRKPPSSTPAL
jgi:amidase